jgi:hypothetical protein
MYPSAFGIFVKPSGVSLMSILVLLLRLALVRVLRLRLQDTLSSPLGLEDQAESEVWCSLPMLGPSPAAALRNIGICRYLSVYVDIYRYMSMYIGIQCGSATRPYLRVLPFTICLLKDYLFFRKTAHLPKISVTDQP